MPFLMAMKRRIVFILVAVGMIAAGRASAQELRLMFWNLENFFDCFDSGGGESDAEFSSRGAKHWTKKRFEAKCHAIAKTVLWLAG